MKIAASVTAVNFVGKAMKWENFVRRSTTTKMTVLLVNEGRWVIIYMEISSQTWLGVGSGCKRLYGA